MPSFDLTGRTAIVTGGNGGIGRGIALALAEAGAAVCIAGRNATKNAAVEQEIRVAGGRAVSVVCDVTRTADVDATIRTTKEAFGGVQILVNNAGIAIVGPPEHLSDDDWQQVIDTNLSSVFRFCRAVHPELVAAGGGKILNIGSAFSIFGGAGVAAYGASKGGVIQLTKSLAVSWAQDAIQVNAIIPGWITTDMTEHIRQLDRYRQIIERTPAGRFGEPEECGGAAVFLTSPAADFVTGQCVVVDGGYTIS